MHKPELTIEGGTKLGEELYNGITGENIQVLSVGVFLQAIQIVRWEVPRQSGRRSVGLIGKITGTLMVVANADDLPAVFDVTISGDDGTRTLHSVRPVDPIVAGQIVRFNADKITETLEKK